MMYLLDASVFIQLANIDGGDELRLMLDWLDEGFNSTRMGSVAAVRTEVTDSVDSNDELLQWIELQRDRFRRLDRYSIPMLGAVSKAAADGNELSAVAAFMRGSELFVIAQALANSAGTTVVTCEPETSKHWKVTVPTVCKALNLSWVTPHEMLRDAGASFAFPG